MQGEKTPKNKKKFPLRPILIASLSLALTAALVHLIAAQNAAFADVLTTRVSSHLRAILGFLTLPFPFSTVELFLLSIPVLLFFLILLARKVAKKREGALRMLSVLLSIPLLLYSLFVFTFASGYYTTPLDQKMSLSEKEPDGESLYALALLLAERAEGEREGALITVGDGGSKMPFSYPRMNLHLVRAYGALSEEYSFLSRMAVGTKPVLLSKPMAYTGITGVYTFFTGEANVCTAFPDFSTVFTAAHEMAHARGIAREDEANFVAFLACTHAEEPYLRYAGYANLLQYVMNALYDTDPELSKQAKQAFSESLLTEYRAYNACVRKYAGSIASDVAGGINNAYLEGMGTEGTVSYDLVVRLAVQYFEAEAPRA